MMTRNILTSNLGLLASSKKSTFCLLILYFLSIGAAENKLAAQCNFSGSAGPVLSAAYDTNTVSYTSSYEVFIPSFGSIVDVTSMAVVEICFYGDMNNSTETWTTTISGVSSTNGAFGATPSAGSPACQTYQIAANTIESDLSDGAIAITYSNFGSGWLQDDSFNAFVNSVSFDYDIDVTVTDPTDRCQDSTDITFVGSPADGTAADDVVSLEIFPATTAFNSSTGVLDVSEVEAGDYTVEYTYEANGCTYEASTDFTIFGTPQANLRDLIVDCDTPGDSVNLQFLFNGANDAGGVFSIAANSPDVGIILSDQYLDVVDGGGCYLIRYDAPNPDGCLNDPYFDEAFLFISTAPNPAFSITGATSPVDSDGSDVNITLNDLSSGPNPELTIDGGSFDTTVIDFGAFALPAPQTVGSITYEICLSETNDPISSCDTIMASDVIQCTESVCETFIVFNDGIGDTPFDSECVPGANAPDPCPVSTRANLTIECAFLDIDGPDVVTANVDLETDLVLCSDDSVCFDWQGTIPGVLGTFLADDVSFSDLSDETEAACDIITFEFCVPIPVVQNPCFDPIPLGDFEDLCDQTLGEFLSENLASVVGAEGGGGGGIVVADTDGDGAFDMIVDEYDFFESGTDVCVPNNIQGPNGVISIRNVVTWPRDPNSICGVVVEDQINLISILPIDAIPIVGDIIEAILEAASCDVPLDFSNADTKQVSVLNTTPPAFANCNDSGYIFSEDGVCDTEANWSIPVVYDGCYDSSLPYIGRTAGTDDSFFAGTAPSIVTVDGSGLYQTGGPIPGSNLPTGTYTVTYTAYSCSGQEETCSFPVVVTSGDPVLACPDSTIIKTDTDVCSTVVTGLFPRQGASCASIINYDISFADGSSTSTNTTFDPANVGTHNDASGQIFPLGESVVTYTMLVDINGDGDVADENEMQSCTFTVNVIDAQRPTANCIDVDVQLDNTGSATVFAVDQNNGSAYINGGSFDNCDTDLDIQLAKPGEAFGSSVSYACDETGANYVTLQATDDAGNVSTCIAQVQVQDFFDGIQLQLDIPELCLENTNPNQVDFSNYLTITLPNGTTLTHDEVENNTFLGDAVGGFGITAFAPAPGTASVDPGSIAQDGDYTMGAGTGYVTISYILGLPGADIPQNGNAALGGCFQIVHETFELRQPLEMDSPECECIVQNDRIVNLDTITGGLEPYTIQYSGVQLDFDSDGIADDVDGEFTYEGSKTGSTGIETVFDLGNFNEDLGNLLVDYTQPTWAFTIVDARGCELFRSGSCDNDDFNGAPEIECTDLGPVDLFTEEELCEAEYTWEHPVPTDNCDVIIYNYTITNPDGTVEGPFDLVALLNPAFPGTGTNAGTATYEFQHISPTMMESVVTYYAEDAVGNSDTCSFLVSVTDTIKPFFINCPEPAVIVDAIEGQCQAFANYSLPLADDNCDLVSVTQVDTTGLISGDLYPVGITINTFEALDRSGNTMRCDVKVIVNDIFLPPTFSCPDDVTQTADPGDCGAVVDDIAPSGIMDNCIDNVTTIYKIEDQDGNLVGNGLDDASGNFFDLGANTVSYATQDMPLLLITELTHDIDDVVDGTLPLPAYTATTPPNGDYLEITNFNSAVMDVSCLTIERVTAMGIDSFNVPTFTLLEPGETLVLHFGPGTDDQAANFFNLTTASDLTAADAAAYIISLSRTPLDVLIVGDVDISALYTEDIWDDATTIAPVNGSGVIRTTVWDTDSAADFVAADACNPTTIGSLNPQLPLPTPNGAQTAIQANPIVRVECAPFTVTIIDEEAAVCGLYGDYNTYGGGSIDVAFGECIETIIPVGDTYNIADVNLSLLGDVGDLGNLTITLISPEGEEVTIVEAACAGSTEIDVTFDGDFGTSLDMSCGALNIGDTIMPAGDIEAFNGEAVNGDWILQIAHNGVVNTAPVAITDFGLLISAREDYTQGDVTLDNDPGLCQAEFTYLHPILFDNCPGGTVQQTITFEDGAVELDQALPIFPENTEFTYNFRVGVTTVVYTLTDASGNESSCGFSVTVLDVETPILVCPSDTTIQLVSGACEIAYTPTDWSATDNCFVSDTIVMPPFSTPLPIGDNVITLTVQDSSGNDTTCMYTVTVLENIPDPVVMSCITNINIHLGPSCEREIITEMLLTGDDFFCFDNYEITLLRNNPDGTQDTLPDNIVTVADIGQEIIYQVFEPRTQQMCWGYINVGFYEEPEFICPADTVVACNAFSDVALLGEPVLLSCALAGASVTFSDTLIRNELCDDPRATLLRTWLVEDNFGNSSSCVQTIIFDAFDLDDIIFPPNYDNNDLTALSCVAVAANPLLTDPINTGFPTVNGGDNIFQNNFCSASFLFTDETFEICPGSFEIIRTWKVRNTCLPFVPGVNPREAVQIIQVLDADAPVITCPDTAVVSTGPFNCEAAYAIPVPEVEENCSGFTYTVSTSAGDITQLPDGSYVVSGLELGTYSITYEVTDGCGRFNSCTYFLVVNDQVTGTAICEDGLNVSLDGNGIAQLSADEVDGGSDDLCGSVELSIRRTINRDPNTCDLLGTPTLTEWGPTVDLNCCDIPDSLVDVELRVIDEEGNESTCWTSILVEDKLAPTCIAPTPLFVNCNELGDNFPNDLALAFANDPTNTAALLDDLFGTAVGVDNCGSTLVTQTVQDSRTSCGAGLIARTFFVTDEQGLVNTVPCVQQIVVQSVHDYTVVFPGDQESINDCVEPDYNGVTYEHASCDLITVATSQDTFQATADECYKLRIAYEVINWCEYQTTAAAYIIPRDADNDGILINDSTVLHVIPRTPGTEDDIAILDRDTNRDNANNISPLDTQDGGLVDGASSLQPYGTDPSRGFFQYDQFILVYDNVPPVLTVTDTIVSFCSFSTECDASVTLPFMLTDLCSPTSVMPVVELDDFIDLGTDGIFTLAEFSPNAIDVSNEVAMLDSVQFEINLTAIPIGLHALRITSTDGCGNSAVALLLFEVNDCKAPTPICINGLTATLMPDGQGGGMAEVWVSDFLASPVDDCSGPVTFAIYRSDTAIAGGDNFVPDSDDDNLMLNCDDQGPLSVRIYAIDASGNFDYCETSLLVQLFSGSCGPTNVGSISGTVTSLLSEPVEDVSMEVSNNGNGLISTFTDASGLYIINDLPLGEDYTLEAQANPPVSLANVSTGDIVQISRHILAIATFDNPYQLIAGDVNLDGTVNIVDIIHIRRIILGLDAGFPMSDSWNFYVDNNGQLDQVYNVNNLSGNIIDADFVAIEMGNVTDADPNGNFQSNQGEARSSSLLNTQDLKLIPGEQYEVRLSAADLVGMQGSMQLSPGVELLDVEFNSRLDGGLNLTTIANGTFAFSLANVDESDETNSWLTLSIRATSTGKLSEMITLNDRITRTEAYGINGDIQDLGLGFAPIQPELTTGLQLLSNVPNPFRDQTSIRYQLDRPQAVTLEVRDLNGRLVLRTKQEAVAGNNSFIVTNNELGAAGVYEYLLITDNSIASQKMVLVR